MVKCKFVCMDGDGGAYGNFYEWLSEGLRGQKGEEKMKNIEKDNCCF